MRTRPGAVSPSGQGLAVDPLAVVRAAMTGQSAAVADPGRRVVGGEFSLTTVSPSLRRLGMLYAIYLCFSALRVQEIVTPLAIPKLPMTMSLALLVGLAFGVPIHGWGRLWRYSPALRWQVLLAGLAVVTVPLGIWMGNSFRFLFPGYFLAVVVFLCGLVLLRDRIVFVRTFRLLAATGALIGTLLLLGVGVSYMGTEQRMMFGVTLDPNDLAWTFATLVPIALWLAVRDRSAALIWWGCAIVLAIGIVKTQSRGGFVALLASGLVLILFGFTGWRRIAMTATLTTLGAILLAVIESTGASRLTDFGTYEGGTGRAQLWSQGIRWMMERPWGLGMGNYSTYNVMITGEAYGAHSAYIGVGVELGVLGLLAFGAIWIGVVRGIARQRSIALVTASTVGGHSEAAFLGFFLSAIAANMVGSAFLHTQFSPLTLLMQGAGAALVVRGSVPQPNGGAGSSAAATSNPLWRSRATSAGKRTSRR